MYARVIVDIANANVDRTFHYLVPEGMEVLPGHRVMVPFGAGNRRTEGFVIEITDELPEKNFEIKPILGTMEAYTVLLPEQLELAEWIQANYRCLYVDALRLMIPAQLRGGRVKEKRIKTVRLADGMDIENVRELLMTKKGKVRSPIQLEVVELLNRLNTPMSLTDIYGFIPNSQAAVRSLTERGILIEEGFVTFRSPYTESVQGDTAPVLNDGQRAALDGIKMGLEKRSGVYLLHGVTGSGKTEVYMNAIAAVTAEGGTAITLVPEISLTPQTVDRFKRRFGDTVAVLHSRLSAGERYDEWRRIRLGKVKVVVGARRALSAPLENLRLIIIDEEHEPSYQSEKAPRYIASEVAAKRCRLSGAVLVLASATPSVPDYFKAKRGRYALLEMPERISNIPMPHVETVDMRNEFMEGNNSIFSAKLYEELKNCLEAGEQAILFVNRRGYSTFISCRGCGSVIKCDRCDVSLTYHKLEGVLKCHYCGRVMRLPKLCPECGKPYLKYFGIGTQQVEEQFIKTFPGYACLRMDTDTTTGKNSHRDILKAFEKGEASVLIGTQMVAKGLDIPNVTLVGVIAADSMLHIPDFRSCERTFQLITQVAGRAGRKSKQGRVILQTYSPEHPAIEFASKHDYCGFYEYEIEQRRRAMFPPYSLFMRVLFTSVDEQTAEQLSEEAAEGIRRALESVIAKNGGSRREVLLVLASPSPVKKRQGEYRYQVLIKLARTKNASDMIDAVYDYMAKKDPHGLSAIQINPNDMF